MRRGTAKDALLRVRWKEQREWGDILIVIRHHGAPGDRKTIAGTRVTDTGASFFEVDGETQIPYHRIQRIVRGDEVLYERATSSPGSSSPGSPSSNKS